MNQQVVVKNLLITYSQAAGQGNKPIVFLHGWRSSKEVWNGLISKLPAASYQLLAVDLPGFGASSVPKNPMTVGDYAEVVAEFAAKLGLREVIIVGHSFGGRVGIKLASVRPELVGKLVLVDSAGFAVSQQKKKTYGFIAKILKPLFRPKFMQPLRTLIYKKIGAEDYLATPELRQTYINVVSEDLSADMEKIVCPTLIVYGENDADTPVEFGRRMNQKIKNSKLVILENAGHFSFLDSEKDFIEQVLKFI